MSEGLPEHGVAGRPERMEPEARERPRPGEAQDADGDRPPTRDDLFVAALGDRLDGPDTGETATKRDVIGESSDIRALPPGAAPADGPLAKVRASSGPAHDASGREHRDLDNDEALDEPPPAMPSDSAEAFAEFEDDEFAGETTRIDDSTLLAEASTAIIQEMPAQPFLFVERGKDEGREFVLQEGENAVGRGIDNDVILTDVAVSRRHLIVIREGDVLRLRDLGSGNGTIVNGKKVTSGVLLEGDRIELGETTLVVRQPGAALGAEDPDASGELTVEATVAEAAGVLPIPDSTPAAGSSASPYLSMTHPAVRTGIQAGSIVLPRPVFVAIVAGGALLLTMFGAAVAVLALKDRGGSAAEGAAIASEPTSSYERGREALRNRDYRAADFAFQAALQEGDSHDDLQDLAGRAASALVQQRALRDAEQHVQTDPRAALNVAQAIQRDSPLYRDAQNLIRQAQGVQIGVLSTEFDDAFERGQLPRLRTIYESALRIRADDPRVVAMANRLSDFDPEAGAMAVPAADGPGASDPSPTIVAGQPVVAADPPPPDVRGASPPADSDERSGGRGRRGRGGPRQVSTAEGLQHTVIQQYSAGSFESAAGTAREGARRTSGAERDQFTRLASNIERFGGLWRRIQRASFGPSGTDEMSQAMALDRHIARSSPYRDRLRPHLVDAYLARAARTQDTVAKCSAIRSALSIDPQNGRARALVGSCAAEARQLMERASHQPEAQAIASYQRVLRLVPSNDPLAGQARQRMAAVRRTRVRDEDQ
ncbi:MAG: FHA domain-containing protein [Sandaracinaceae bacterium]